MRGRSADQTASRGSRFGRPGKRLGVEQGRGLAAVLIGQLPWFCGSAWLHAPSGRFVHRGSPSRIVIAEWEVRGFVAPCYAVAVHFVVRRCASFVVRRCASFVVRRCASFVVRRCALLLAQIQSRFGRRFGVGLGAISDVVSSAILALFRALSCAVRSAVRALFEGVILCAISASFRRGAKHHIERYIECCIERYFKHCPYIVHVALVGVSGVASGAASNAISSVVSRAPSRLSWRLSGVVFVERIRVMK